MQCHIFSQHVAAIDNIRVTSSDIASISVDSSLKKKVLINFWFYWLGFFDWCQIKGNKMKILLYLCFLVQTSAGKNKKLKNEVLDKSEESDFSETFIGDGQDGEIKGNQALNLPDDDFDTEVTVV